MSDEKLEWQIVERGERQDYQIFSVYRHHAEHRASDRSGLFTVVDSPNWVNVIALTQDNQVIFVRQYRHGVDKVTLEIPGGLVDGEESFLSAGLRELEEETGYTTEHAELIGVVEPNPAFMNNRCGIVLARNVVLSNEQALDPNEVIDVVTYPLETVKALIKDGVIAHTLVISAFYFLSVHEG